MWEVPGWAIGVAFIILAASLGKALRPLLRAQADRISGRGVADPDIAQVRNALEDIQKRVGELEERLDFTERLLAKQRDAERLAPPRG